MCNFTAQLHSLFTDYDCRYMKEWTWWILCLTLILLTGCDSESKEQRLAREQLAKLDSLEEARQLRAWMIYAHDLYVYGRGKHVTFEPNLYKEHPLHNELDEFLKATPPQRVVMQQAVKEPNAPITLPNSITFALGQLSLEPGQDQVLKEIARIMKKDIGRYKFSVEAYVSDEELELLPDGMDQWEMSSERATFIVRELVKAGVSPHHLAAVGKGSFDLESDTGRRSAVFIRYPLESRY